MTALGLVLGPGVLEVKADAPLPPPEIRTVCSRNGFFCARMDPDLSLTTVFRRRAGGVTEPLWSMPGWFREASLSNDGQYLVAGYDGGNLLPLDVRKDQVMLSFFDRGRLIRQVRLNDLVPDVSKLTRTVSHYHWGRFHGLNSEGHLVVELADKQWVLFDPRTGLPIR
jgi:hypothetical protein